MTAATLHGGDSSLASQCLALCQTLVSQGKAFTFSLKIDSTFSFSLDSKESLASAPLPEVLTRKKVSPSTKRRNARRRAEFLKKKQSSFVQLDVPSIGSASATSEQLVTSEKSDSSPAREADQPPPFELNGGVVYCDKCPDGCLDFDALCIDPYKCTSDCGISHYHRQYPGDDFVWAFRKTNSLGGDILHCLGSCPPSPGCPCCRVWRP